MEFVLGRSNLCISIGYNLLCFNYSWGNMESKSVKLTLQIVFLFEILLVMTGCSFAVFKSESTPLIPVTLSLSNLPAVESTLTTASISYKLDNASGAERVYCRRDNHALMTCPNPFVFDVAASSAEFGTHQVDFFVDDGKGIIETTPHISYSWNIVKPEPRTSPARLSLSNLPAVESIRKTAAITYKLSNALGAEQVYCRVDKSAPKPCPNPFVLKNKSSLALGVHTVEFFVNPDAETLDSTPHVSYSWKIVAGRARQVSNRLPAALGSNAPQIVLVEQ